MIKNCLFIWHPIKVSIKWEWLYNIFPNLILSSAFLCCLERNQMAKHDLKAYLSADDKNTPFKRPNGNLYSKKDGFLRKPFNLLNIEGGGEKKVSGSFSCFEKLRFHTSDGLQKEPRYSAPFVKRAKQGGMERATALVLQWIPLGIQIFFFCV